MRLFSILWWIIIQSLKVKSIWICITYLCVYCPFNTHTHICVCVCVCVCVFVCSACKLSNSMLTKIQKIIGWVIWVENVVWTCIWLLHTSELNWWTVTNRIEGLQSAATNRNKRELLKHCVYIKCIFGILHFMLHSLWCMSLSCL
jgi:hypothetical protein